jgi:hypothetical protein
MQPNNVIYRIALEYVWLFALPTMVMATGFVLGRVFLVDMHVGLGWILLPLALIPGVLIRLIYASFKNEFSWIPFAIAAALVFVLVSLVMLTLMPEWAVLMK